VGAYSVQLDLMDISVKTETGGRTIPLNKWPAANPGVPNSV